MIRWFEKHNGISWIIVFLIGSIIFYFSTLSFKQGTGGGGGYYSIIYHIGIFFLLGLFLHISVIKGKERILLFVPILIVIFYGVTDEIHQLFVPGRAGSLSDVILDSIGAIFAFIFYSCTLVYRDKLGYRL